MKRIRIYLCAVIFTGLTVVKLVSPAAAAEIRALVLPEINREGSLASVEAYLPFVMSEQTEDATTLYEPESPLEQMQQARQGHAHRYFTDLPASLLHPEPSEEIEQELSHSAEMDAAYAARESFLSAQAAFADQTLPANVSYDIPELPFETVTPVSGYTSSGFGFRMHPIQNKVKFHYGTDFAANTGTDICAFADGVVLAAGEDAGYGSYVKLSHPGGFVTLYGHCSALLVSAGETVTAGQPIARVGATGQATGPHLHFELIHDGIYLNPEFYLAA